MNFNTYSDVVDKLNEYAAVLRDKALRIIADFEQELRIHKLRNELCYIPVMISNDYGLSTIGWFDTVKKENIYTPVVSTIYNFDELGMSKWYVQLVKKTEQSILEIKSEMDFLIGVFKKVHYWKTKI